MSASAPPPRLPVHALYRRLRAVTTFVGSLAWTAAGLSLILLLAPVATRPSLETAAVGVGCTMLAFAFSLVRFEYRHGDLKLANSPDAGFLVLIAIVLGPTWAAVAGAVAISGSIRRAGTLLERAFLASTGALATGMASLFAHEAFVGSIPLDRTVLLAAVAGAVTRAITMLVGQVLLAEARVAGGGFALLRTMPIGSMLALEIGLPSVTVGAAGAFLDRPALAMLVVLGGQVLTWRVLRIQHEQFRGHVDSRKLIAALHRAVPEHVARRILSGSVLDQHTLQGSDRVVTVLVLSVHGFAIDARQDGPHHMVAELDRFLAEASTVITTAGGSISGYVDGKLAATWNAPIDQQDHAERAVRSIPTLLRRVRETNIARDVHRRPRIDVGIGVASGRSIVGTISVGDHGSCAVVDGDVVARALQLADTARASGIAALVDDNAHRMLSGELERQFTRIVSPQPGHAATTYAPNGLVRDRADIERADVIRREAA